MREKLVKLLENEDFINKILSIKTDEEVRNEFKSNGVELSDEELENIKKAYGKVMETLEKLDDDTLKELSGGRRKDGWRIFGIDLNAPLDIFRSRRQILANEAVDVVIDNGQVIFDTVMSVGKTLIGGAVKLGSSVASQSNSRTPTEAAPSSNEKMAGTVAAVVALSVGAGIVYKNRRAIKRWWNSSK